MDAFARKIDAARRKEQMPFARRPLPDTRQRVQAAKPVVAESMQVPRKSPLLEAVRGAVTALGLVAGLGAAWGVGVVHGSLSVPEISVVEVDRPSVLPKCENYDREKGVCVR